MPSSNIPYRYSTISKLWSIKLFIKFQITCSNRYGHNDCQQYLRCSSTKTRTYVFILQKYDLIHVFKKNISKLEKGHPLLTAFSVYTNAPKIFTVKATKNPNVIHCLAGLRSISMMWVVFGHGYMTFNQLPHLDRNKFYTVSFFYFSLATTYYGSTWISLTYFISLPLFQWIETPYSMLVQNATFCVDTFFFMSGLLMLWGAFREMEKTWDLNIINPYFFIINNLYFFLNYQQGKTEHTFDVLPSIYSSYSNPCSLNLVYNEFVQIFRTRANVDKDCNSRQKMQWHLVVHFVVYSKLCYTTQLRKY